MKVGITRCIFGMDPPLITTHAIFSLPDGRSFHVLPGGLIGRMAGCAVQLDDIDVSEAHAFVSWRERKLRLLSLRGAILANGTAVAEIALRPNLEIRLSASSVLSVEDVAVPDEFLWLEGIGAGPQALTGAPLSICGSPPRIVPGLRREAWVWLWTENAVWYARARGGEPTAVAPDQRWETEAGPVRAVPRVRTDVVGVTRPSGTTRVQLVLAEGVVRIRSGESPPLILGGNQGDFVRQLAEATEPVHWTTIARYFWGERDQLKWRERFDAMVKEVRGKLRENRIRKDLLWSWDGSYRLNLDEGDTVTAAG